MQNERKNDAAIILQKDQKDDAQNYSQALLEVQGLKEGVEFKREGEETNTLILTVPKENQEEIQKALTTLGIPNLIQNSDNSTTILINLNDVYRQKMQDVMNCAYPMVYSYIKTVIAYLRENPNVSLNDMFQAHQDPFEFQVGSSFPKLFVRFVPKGKKEELTHVVDGVDLVYAPARYVWRKGANVSDDLEGVMSLLALPTQGCYNALAKIVMSKEFKLFSSLSQNIHDSQDHQKVIKSYLEDKEKRASTFEFFKENPIMPEPLVSIIGNYIQPPALMVFVACVKGILDKQDQFTLETHRYGFGGDFIAQLCRILQTEDVPTKQPRA